LCCSDTELKREKWIFTKGLALCAAVCVVVCCNVWLCCSVLREVERGRGGAMDGCSVLQCVAVCCSDVLQCVAARVTLLQR